MNYKTIKRLKVRSFYFLGFAFFIALLSACVGDSILSEEDRLSSNEAYAELLLKSSGTVNSENKAVYDSDINSLTVLVFKHDRDKNPVFAYKAPVSAIKKQENGKFLVSTKLKISQTEDDKYSLALIANEEISDADLASYKGFPKETLIKKLNFQSTHLDKQDYFWKDKYLPMYGESEPKYISKVPQVWGTIYMIRSVAKVTIDIQSNDQNLVFGELYIHNAVSKGRYASDVHSSFLEGNNTPSNTKVTLPDFNTNETQYTNWVKFVDFATQSATPIILSENEGGSRDDVDKTTCFVLGLKKDKDSKISYYRLDIPKMLESGGFDKEKTEPILRNRHYVVKVNKVEGDGADNKEDALKKEVEIDCTVHIGEWNLLENEYEFEDLGENEWLKAEDGRNFIFTDVDNSKDVVKLQFKTKIDSKRVEIDLEGNDKFFKLEKSNATTEGFTLNCSVMESKWQEFTTSTQAYYTISLVVKDHKEVKEKMRVPLRIYAPKQDISEIAPNDPNFKQKIIGKYIRGTKVDAKQHYIECRVAVSYLTSLGVGLEDLSIFTNTVNGYKFAKNTIGTQEARNSDGFYIIKVPASGTPINEGIDNFTLNYKFSKSVGDNQNFTTTKYTQLSNEVIVENLVDPYVENLRILFVADGYSFSEDAGSFGKHINMGRVLRGERNFSLMKGVNEAIRVKPFEFRHCTTYYTWNVDDIPRNIIYWAKNLKEVEDVLFKDTRDEYVSKWEDFDIIYYIRSSNPNELRENKYAKVLKTFVESKDKVLVQTPSSRMKERILSDENYEDPLLGLKVERSSALFSNQRAVKINERSVGFPYKEGETSSGSEFRDFNYVTSKLKSSQYKSLAEIRVVKKLVQDYPAIIRKEGDMGNHLWIGSSYFFIDKVLKATVSGVPNSTYLLTKGGWLNANGDFITIGEHKEKVHNSTYFLDTMRWAINKIGERRTK